MEALLLTVHIIICVFLIFIVLIQSSKGAQMGAAFGGSSQTIFGSRGATTFLSKFTTAMAIIFMVTSLLLAFLFVRKGSIIKPTTTKSIPNEKSLPIDKAGVKPSGEQQQPTEDSPQKEE